MNRRTFLQSSLAAGAALGTGVLGSGQTTAAPRPSAKPPIDPASVKEFVVAGHGNLPRVKEMLGAEPMFVNMTWDWGVGDIESAIGGAAHVGNRELALHLIDAGSRFDGFCAAMLGETGLVKSMLDVHPAIANARGPHGYTLLYHVGYTGDVALAETVAGCIVAEKRSAHFNQALQTAVNRGHVELVAYMLEHGVDDPNSRNGRGRTPLDVALEKDFDAVARLLRDHGAVTSG